MTGNRNAFTLIQNWIILLVITIYLSIWTPNTSYCCILHVQWGWPTCIESVWCLVEGMQLPYKNYRKSIDPARRLPRYEPLKIATSAEHLEHLWLFTWHVPRPSPRCINSSQLWGRRDGATQQRRPQVNRPSGCWDINLSKAFQTGPGRAANAEIFPIYWKDFARS